MPSGLHDEAMKLVERRFFNGMSDLIQQLLREAIEEHPGNEKLGI
jgi:Arc/MetJ-type ribon-helix-helix transcriptional regulator